MSVPYSIDSSATHYKNYYINQAGGALPAFRGKTIQHGTGLGGVFSNIFKGIAPVLKQVAKSAGKQLVNTGKQIVSDKLAGKPLGESIKTRFSEGGQNLLEKLSAHMTTPKVGGAKRKSTTKKPKSSKTKKRRLTKDIFK